MQFLNQLLKFIHQGVDEILKWVKLIWEWSMLQIEQVPWDNMGVLWPWKALFLVVVGAVIIYLLYASVKSLLEAGMKALAAIATLLGVVIQTLLPVMLAGLAAAGGAYVVNNIHF